MSTTKDQVSVKGKLNFRKMKRTDLMDFGKVAKIFAGFLLGLLFFNPLYAQSQDWRNAKNGFPIYTNGYCDQPYVVVLANGKWLCVFTTNAGEEGSGGQHIVSSISEDQGKTWSEPVRIEQPGKESASWAMPYLTDYGRVYAFYVYNGDKIHELKDRKNIREDMLGWYCYKYSDDEGKTWSERYRIDIPNKPVDLNNQWNGDVQIFWGVGKPIDFEGGMMLAFTKIGKYMLEYSEGWLIHCNNINKQKDPKKLKFELLPETDAGIKNPELGVINSEQNIFQLSKGTLYSMHRTVSGYPAESYSTNGGKSWTTPQPPEYENGIKIKNPRAAPRIWKCKNGKYLFWYHNNGGWNFGIRNPAWLSGGIEKDGKIIWSQPEILFYEDEPAVRMSYPDLIEQDGKYWITETNKANARVHEIPNEFLQTLWSQFEINEIEENGLVSEWKDGDIPEQGQLVIPSNTENSYADGFTIDFRLVLANLNPGQLIMSSKDNNGKRIEVKTGDFGAIEIRMFNGEQTDSWSSDPGLVKANGVEYHISVTVDNGPRIIQFVINGTVNNGRNFRQFGWGRYTVDMTNFQFNTIEIHKMAGESVGINSKIKNLKLYNQPLMNTKIIGNHRFRTNEIQNSL
jgi:hypothetical protein